MHYGVEEMFFVLSGTPTVRTPDGEELPPVSLLKVGDAEGRLVGDVGGDPPGCWQGLPGGLVGHWARRRFPRNRRCGEVLAAGRPGCSRPTETRSVFDAARWCRTLPGGHDNGRSASWCRALGPIPARPFHPRGLEAEARERLSWLRMRRR